MEKNGNRETEASAPQRTVQVTDEAGNRYEATYPKRAKGLVKHGRARFTDESQTEIILTCPPNQNLILEDKTMTEQNTNIQTDKDTVTEKNTLALTAKEVFDQIVSLQNLMSSEYTNPLHSLNQTVGSICENEWESDEHKAAAINSASTPYMVRERTYQQMLELYRQMYNDLYGNQKTEQTCDKIQVIARSFKDHAAMIKDTDSEDEDAKFDALRDISERIENLISSVL